MPPKMQAILVKFKSFSLPQPSPRTRTLWGPNARHAIRIEVVICALCLFCIIFSIAQLVMTGDTFYFVWDLPAPVFSLAFAAAAIYAFTRRALHPVYSLSIAIVLFLGWIATLFFVYIDDKGDIEQAIDFGYMQWYRDGHYAPPGLVVVKDICYGVVTVTQLVHIGFAAKAIHDLRRRRRQGIFELDDGMDLELVPKTVDSPPAYSGSA
ncbi:hypothetical protein LTR85_000001 [Meristemomyces frigidus]|nr:hypothetical protein LTR85_000001 [Meristemomyces frigidus]